MLKILFVSPYFPYYNKGGGGAVSFNRIKSLSKFAQIDLIFLSNGNESNKYKNEVKMLVRDFEGINQRNFEVIKNIFFYFPYKSLRESFAFSKNFVEILKKKTSEKKYDVIWFNHERTFQYSFYIKKGKKLIDLHDVTSERHKKMFFGTKNLFLKLIHLYEYFRIKNLERKILKNMDGVIVISKNEKIKLKKRNKVYEVPFCLDIETKKGEMKNEEKNILFIGDMNYYPNKDALFYFVKKIYPIIKKDVKNVKLLIVGPSIDKKVKKLQNEDIIVKGFIPSIDEVYSNVNVLAVPLRIATGIRIKILEAMARGVPIVSTKIGCEGIRGLKNEVNIIIEDDPLRFAKGIERLLNDKKFAEYISKNARNLIERYYSTENLKEIVEKIINDKK
ncbi:MAG: glycosyltransferase [candidate division WOR-3 bacterium]